MSKRSSPTDSISQAQQAFTDNLNAWEIESTLIHVQQAGIEEPGAVSCTGPPPAHHEYIEAVLKERPLKIACDAVIRHCEAGASHLTPDQRREWLFLLETIIPLWNRRTQAFCLRWLIHLNGWGRAKGDVEEWWEYKIVRPVHESE